VGVSVGLISMTEVYRTMESVPHSFM